MSLGISAFYYITSPFFRQMNCHADCFGYAKSEKHTDLLEPKGSRFF